MHYVDMATWPRREHYELFGGFNHPHVGLCANVDVSDLRRVVTQQGVSFTAAFLFLLTRAANAIPAFRQRIREDGVVEHDRVHPGFTMLVEDDLFSFCIFDYDPQFSVFARRASDEMARVKAHPSVAEIMVSIAGRDELMYTSVIPWVSFTGFMHPMHFHPTDSIPRFAWGRYFEQGGRLLMPLAVQGHHALVDGLHIGRFYQHVEQDLAQPEQVLGAQPVPSA